MLGSLTTILVGLLVFSFLVVVHELGHFLAAKKFGVPVKDFAIGFGPALYKKQIGETEYRLNAIPLGGYVRMEGEDEAGYFNSMAVWKRMTVVAAGPIFNLIAAVLVFAFVFAAFGSLTISTQVQSIVKGSPAAQVLQAKDELIKIGNTKIQNPDDVVKAVQATKGEKTPVIYRRNGQENTTYITPTKNDNRWQLGIQLQYLQDFRPPRANPIQAIAMGTQQTWDMTKEVFKFFGDAFSGKKEALSNVGGPILIIKTTGFLAKTNLVMLVYFTAALSVNLGLINLLPFPALDGGRLLLMIVESIRGKALDIEKEAMIHAIGFALLLLLMVVVTVNDVSRVFMR